jgi:fructokinase
MNDFVTLGELLIDFTPAGEKNGRKLYMQNAGGATANVAAAISKLGVGASFLGMVGNDFFGRYLEGVLRNNNVDTEGLAFSDEYLTTLAFVHIYDNGDRDFTFFRRPGADTMYDKKNIDFQKIRDTKVFHFGSLSLTDEPARSATFEALEFARANGVAISYDPNYRAPLWNDEKTAKKYIMDGLVYADILKISDEEATLLFGGISNEKAAENLINAGIKLLFITLGSEGAFYASAEGSGRVKAYPAKVVDTTGAGDCFMAGVVYKYLRCGRPLKSVTLKDLHDFSDFACAASSICVEGLGGIPSMPNIDQVNRRMNK